MYTLSEDLKEIRHHQLYTKSGNTLVNLLGNHDNVVHLDSHVALKSPFFTKDIYQCLIMGQIEAVIQLIKKELM